MVGTTWSLPEILLLRLEAATGEMAREGGARTPTGAGEEKQDHRDREHVGGRAADVARVLMVDVLRLLATDDGIRARLEQYASWEALRDLGQSMFLPEAVGDGEGGVARLGLGQPAAQRLLQG